MCVCVCVCVCVCDDTFNTFFINGYVRTLLKENTVAIKTLIYDALI